MPDRLTRAGRDVQSFNQGGNYEKSRQTAWRAEPELAPRIALTIDRWGRSSALSDREFGQHVVYHLC